MNTDPDFCNNCHWLTLKKGDLEVDLEYLRSEREKLLAVIKASRSVLLEARDSSGTLWCSVQRIKLDALKDAFKVLDEGTK